MASVNWNENLPSGNSAILQGDDDIRSLTTSLRQALADEHDWVAGPSVADRGKHTPNASRISYSNVVNAPATVSDRTGLLFQETNVNQRTFAFVETAAGSERSYRIGGRRVIESASNPGSAENVIWEESHQTGLSDAAITFDQLYDGTPFVTAIAESTTPYISVIHSLSSREVTIRTYTTGGVSTPSITVHIHSIGTATI